METEATQPPSGSSAAASYPRWVLLQRQVDLFYSSSTGEDSRPSHDAAADDPNTLATARMTNGHLIGVSFCFAAPPAASCLRVRIPADVPAQHSSIIAAHGDSVLIVVFIRGGLEENDLTDYFVYHAGAAAAEPPRPPSLLLLPPYFLTEEEKASRMLFSPGQVHRTLGLDATGLLRRCDDELVVAELKSESSLSRSKQKAPKLFMLRSGDGEEVSEMLLPPSWRTHTVFPVDDRWLCWVDSSHGVLFLDVLEENPRLQLVPLPDDPYFARAMFRNVCVTAGGAVKFVNIFPRCCCGGAGATYCSHSINAYIVRSWTLRMDNMTWVMDGMVDSTELWSLEAYKDLPRISLAYPVVTLDQPNVICFMLCEDFHVNHGDETLWLITVDMRSKTIPSVCLHPGGRRKMFMENLVPCKVSDYFNSCHNCINGGTLAGKGHTDDSVVDDEVITTDAIRGSAQSSSCKTCADESAMEVSAFLAAFKEIRTYGLARDDMLMAYDILGDDNGRRFKSFVGLPRDLRKDWLLMEIRASNESSSVCSSSPEGLQYA